MKKSTGNILQQLLNYREAIWLRDGEDKVEVGDVLPTFSKGHKPVVIGVEDL